MRPFAESDYPDYRTHAQREREGVQVGRQVESLKKIATDNDYQRYVVARLQRRRRPRADRVQIEPVARPDRVDLLVADGSVVAAGGMDAATVGGALPRDLGVQVRAVDGEARLDVVRDPAHPLSMPELVDRICGCGVRVSVNHVFPLAGYIKGAGGPEPTACLRPYPSVPVDDSAPRPVVVVLDTGVSREQRGDGYLAMAVADEDRDELDEFPPDHLLDAAAGHGSFVAGVVEQVAPMADIRIRKVVDSDGVTTDTRIAAALRAVPPDTQIVNLSLGSETVDGNPPPAMRDAIAELEERGVLVVCAAGNSADADPVWPAAFATTFPDTVVSVAALDAAGQPSDWSSHGDWVRFSAVGEGVMSTYVPGTEDGELIDDPDPDTYGPDSWACWTGSSFAAPQITGAVARLMSERGCTAAEALGALRENAADYRGKGYGYGVVILPGTPRAGA